MKGTTLIASAIATSLLLGANVGMAQNAKTNEKPILGFVVLNETTPAAVKSKLDEMGCSYETNDTSVITTGCYTTLPGNPKVYFRNILGDKIDLVFLSYEKGSRFSGEPQAFEQYANALKKTYGKPGSYRKPFVGDCFASWNKNNVHVEVGEPHLGFEGWVLYETKEVKKAFDDQDKAEKKEKEKSLDLL